MDKSITIRFSKDEWLPRTRDGLDYLLRYSFVDSEFIGKADEAFLTRQAYIVIGISGTLNSMWGFSKNNLCKVLFEYGKRHVETMISEGTLANQTELQLTTYSAPAQCPFDPERIDFSFDSPLEYSYSLENPLSSAEPSSLAFQIVDLRDSINAIFGEQFNGRLLTLPQERHLVELFKSCDGNEEFAYRVASLGGLSTSIDTKMIKAVHKKSKGELKGPNEQVSKSQGKLKPLDFLGEFLRNRYSIEKVNEVMDVFKNFNHLRRMYPIHTDRARGVLSAYRFFEIEYPLSDHNYEWQKLLEKYRDCLKILLGLLKS